MSIALLQSHHTYLVPQCTKRKMPLEELHVLLNYIWPAVPTAIEHKIIAKYGNSCSALGISIAGFSPAARLSESCLLTFNV